MEGLIYKKIDFSENDLDDINTTVYFNNYPVVYILFNRKKRSTAYIGQTVQADKRLKSHLSDPKRKVLEHTILIGHQMFNQSATYNIESNLINFFIADNKYKLQNVSQTSNKLMHEYYDKSFYNEDVFQELWDKLLEDEIVYDSIENLKNKDIYKISPYKELTPQQLDIKYRALDYCKENFGKSGNHVFIVEGDAGTGKSVLLSSLFNSIQDYAHDKSSALYKSDNYLLVNHGEMLKTYKNIANSLPNLKKKNLMKPTSFINQKDKEDKEADIVLVDEAHLLLTKKDGYNNFHYDNQLDEIIKRSKVTIVIFDPKQVLKIKSYWSTRLLEEITEQYQAERIKLTDQMRMNASGEILNWIDNFIDKKLTPMPKQVDKNYELKIFENPNMFKEAIEEKNEESGLARIVSTFDYLHKKDNRTYYVDEEGLNMPWNKTQDNITWAEYPETIHEVGSIYTVQGFDLNYVGVVLGPSIRYDENEERLIIDPSKYKDKGAFTARKDLSSEENERIKEDIILNSLNVLMKRGIHGLYIYATDPKLRKMLLSLERGSISE